MPVTVAYYNEIDPFAADWLEALIDAGHIPLGYVDRRPIQDVKASDIADYDQHHFFAGIGGWALALRLAGWPDDKPVWTGSCPCQPFSQAGKMKGTRDARHLWPYWYSLITECRPAIVFGEQVASKAGREWLDAVSLDLEALEYAVGSADLCAAGVGAPHIRQRLWFVGDSDCARWEKRECEPCIQSTALGTLTRKAPQRASNFSESRMADGNRQRLTQRGQSNSQETIGSASTSRRSDTGGCWAKCDWLPCTDGKSRPVEPGSFPLAHGVPHRVGKLRGYGNAIIPQVAAMFIASYKDCAL